MELFSNTDLAATSWPEIFIAVVGQYRVRNILLRLGTVLIVIICSSSLVHQQCSDETRKVCHKVITIQDTEAGNELILLPHLKLKFNGYEFTVQQLINSPICKASFVVSQPGKTLLAVSTKYGFWVQLDDIGIVKVGISSKFIRTVDGLCGYYNGNPKDDKRSPDGQIIPNTEKFGDSWYDKRIPKDQCGDLKCPREMQAKALQLCNIIQ